MKMNFLNSALVITLLASLSQLVLADATAAKTIADILATMNHYPSDEQKEVLMEISTDDTNSPNMQAIARAVHDVQHAATASDKVKMSEITNDTNATLDEQNLARVVAELNHAATPQARDMLAQIE